MAAPERGFFAVGPIEMFAANCNAVAQTFREVGGELLTLSDDGGGYLSPKLAGALVIRIKNAITLADSKYDSRSPAWEEKLGGAGSLFKRSRTLYRSITVLNRRYASGRGSVAGIDDRKSVDHFGWGGKTGGKVKLSSIVSTITYGGTFTDNEGRTVVVPSRLVIPDAIEDFVSSKWPRITKNFWSHLTTEWASKVDKTNSERSSSLKSMANSVPKYPTSSDSGSYIGAEDLAGLNVAGSVKTVNVDDSLRKSFLADGMSAKEIDDIFAGRA